MMEAGVQHLSRILFDCVGRAYFLTSSTVKAPILADHSWNIRNIYACLRTYGKALPTPDAAVLHEISGLPDFRSPDSKYSPCHMRRITDVEEIPFCIVDPKKLQAQTWYRRGRSCYGDSNTYGYNPLTGGKYRTCWVDLLAQKLISCSVINEGILGREIPFSDDRLSLSSADRILIMLGSNDLLDGYSADDCRISVDSQIRFYRQFGIMSTSDYP